MGGSGFYILTLGHIEAVSMAVLPIEYAAETLVQPTMNVNNVFAHANSLDALAAIIGYLLRYGNAYDIQGGETGLWLQQGSWI